MSYYRRAKIDGSTCFFTVVTYRRQPILCDMPIRQALHNAIVTTRSKRPFSIDAWVLLSDHLHCIWTLPLADADFSATHLSRDSMRLGRSSIRKPQQKTLQISLAFCRVNIGAFVNRDYAAFSVPRNTAETQRRDFCLRMRKAPVVHAAMQI